MQCLLEEKFGCLDIMEKSRLGSECGELSLFYITEFQKYEGLYAGMNLIQNSVVDQIKQVIKNNNANMKET